MSKFTTKIVNLTFSLRGKLDNFIFSLVNPFNKWEILDKYKKKDILVVGNGPSLNNTKLEDINMVSIGMNKIDLLFEHSEWRPDIITCINGLVIRQNRKFFNSTDITLILPPRALYLGIRKRKNVLFAKNLYTMEFQNTLDKGFALEGATVTYTALQIASFLNPKSVNIVGVDHYFKNYTGKAAIEKFEGEDANHFDPNYFKNKLWGLPDLETSEIAYKKAKKYFDKHNIPIIDYTVKGKLTVFTKGNIEDIYG